MRFRSLITQGILLSLFLFLNINLIYASDFGFDNPTLPKLLPEEDSGTTLIEGANYSINVNASEFWITSDGDLDNVDDIPWGIYVGQLFNQWLNTTSDVSFNTVNVTGGGCSGDPGICYDYRASEAICIAQAGCSWGGPPPDPCIGTPLACNLFGAGNCTEQTGCSLSHSMNVDNSINSGGYYVDGVALTDTNCNDNGSCLSIIYGGGYANTEDIINFNNGYFAIGKNAKHNDNLGVALGQDANLSGHNSVAIGRESQAYGASIAIGYQAKTSNAGQIVALGAGADVYGDKSVGIGYNADALEDSADTYNTVIGSDSVIHDNTQNSVILGGNTVIGGTTVIQKSIGIGYSSSINESYCVTIGAESICLGEYGTAIGYKAVSNASGAICIGNNCYNDEPNTVKIGTSSIYMKYDEGLINASTYCFQTGECFNETNISSWGGNWNQTDINATKLMSSTDICINNTECISSWKDINLSGSSGEPLWTANQTDYLNVTDYILNITAVNDSMKAYVDAKGYPDNDTDTGNCSVSGICSTVAYMNYYNNGNLNVSTIHILNGATGGTAGTQEDDLVIESIQDPMGMTLLSNNTARAGISFGDTDDEDVGMILYDHDYNYLDIYVNNTLSQRIYDSGEVGHPKQSYFYARMSGQTTVAHNTWTTVGDAVNYNQYYDNQNEFDHTTGIFTAKEAGTYVFFGQTMFYAGNNNIDYISDIVVGGGTGYSYENIRIVATWTYMSHHSYAIKTMTVGQTAYMRVYQDSGGNEILETYTFFGGFRIA